MEVSWTVGGQVNEEEQSYNFPVQEHDLDDENSLAEKVKVNFRFSNLYLSFFPFRFFNLSIFASTFDLSAPFSTAVTR